MRQNRLIVVSADALVAEDMDLLKKLPNFRRYLAGGACVERVRSIYPTITYPCHTTIATGVYPDRHGVHCNLLTPMESMERPVPWYWWHDRVRVPDLFDRAKAAGLTTAAVFWPVTGNHPNIDHLIAEYWTQSPDDDLEAAFARAGTDPRVIDIVRRHRSVMRERIHPQCDDFVMRCACDMIREFKPHLLMIHPGNIDGYRHGKGLFGEAIDQGIYETDHWIGELMMAAEEAGVLDDTTFVLTSDHGQMDIKRVVNLNVYLADAGLIRTDSEGNATDWDAWIQGGGMCAFVFLKDPANTAVKEKVSAVLHHLQEEGVYGVGQVFDAETARREHRLAGDFSFVVETDGYTAFGDRCVRPAVTGMDASDYRSGWATHGYLPAKGPQPVFYCKGPAVRDGAVMENARLVDEASTLAAMLGLEMPDVDGRVLTELLP